MNQVQDYEFLVRFDKPQFPELLVDAPRPMGRSAYPSPSRLLAAAVGHCSASVLLRCARRAGLALGSIEAKVDTRIVRDKRGLPRISKIEIMLDPHLSETQMRPAADARTGFEDLCMVRERAERYRRVTQRQGDSKRGSRCTFDYSDKVRLTARTRSGIER